jgi:hypothetical protein
MQAILEENFFFFLYAARLVFARTFTAQYHTLAQFRACLDDSENQDVSEAT